jgi:hypothetical protein
MVSQSSLMVPASFAYMHRFSRLITDVELSFKDDFHLMVGISVDQWCALLQAVDAAADRLLRVYLVAACHVTQVGVLICDQRWLELRLDFGEMLEGWCFTHVGL